MATKRFLPSSPCSKGRYKFKSQKGKNACFKYNLSKFWLNSSGIVNKTISPFIKGTGTGITLWMSWEVGSRADLWGIQQWSMSQLIWPWHTRPAPVVGDSLNWHNLCRKPISLLVYFETQCLECAPERLQTGPECVGCWLSHSIFLLVTQNIEQMLSETLTWVRSHCNGRTRTEPQALALLQAVHTLLQICYIPLGCLWPIRCNFLSMRSFTLFLIKTFLWDTAWAAAKVYQDDSRTSDAPGPSMPPWSFNFLRSRLACCRLICWVLKPGVMVAGWDGDLSQEHKVPGPVQPHLVCELFYTILLNSHLMEGFPFCVFC